MLLFFFFAGLGTGLDFVLDPAEGSTLTVTPADGDTFVLTPLN